MKRERSMNPNRGDLRHFIDALLAYRGVYTEAERENFKAALSRYIQAEGLLAGEALVDIYVAIADKL